MLATFFITLATALSLLVVDLTVPGVNIATFPAALVAAFAIGLINSFVRPTLLQLSLPLNYLTLGLSSVAINGLCFWLAAILVPGFSIHGLAAAILGPIVLSFVNTFIGKYLAERHPQLTIESGNKAQINSSPDGGEKLVSSGK